VISLPPVTGYKSNTRTSTVGIAAVGAPHGRQHEIFFRKIVADARRAL
jgi:hypothetical protein